MYSNFYVFRQKGRQVIVDRIIASVIWIQPPLKILLNQIWFVIVVSKYLNTATFS
jgi:hypothetical protein